MTQHIYYSDYRSLKYAYKEVKTFIEKESYETVSSLNTKIEKDLSCYGDDNLELLEKFVTKYKLDPKGFDYSKHFLSEGELFGSATIIYMILEIPIIIMVWLLKVITLGKVDLKFKQSFLEPQLSRETSDLTFGDMLVWYLTGKYNLRKEVQVKFKNAS